MFLPGGSRGWGWRRAVATCVATREAVHRDACEACAELAMRRLRLASERPAGASVGGQASSSSEAVVVVRGEVEQLVCERARLTRLSCEQLAG